MGIFRVLQGFGFRSGVKAQGLGAWAHEGLQRKSLFAAFGPKRTNAHLKSTTLQPTRGTTASGSFGLGKL